MEITRAVLPLPLGEMAVPSATLVPVPPIDCQRLSPTYPWDAIEVPAADVPSLGNGLEVSWQTGVVAGVALALTSGAIATVSQPHPAYQAQFELMVAPSQAAPSPFVSPPGVEAAPPILEMSAIDMNTQVQILKSPLLLSPVVEQLGLRQIHLSYDALVANLSIDSISPGVVMIRYLHPSPDIAQVVVDELAEAYVTYSQECRLEACRGLSYVEAQIPLVQERIQTTQTDLQQLQKRLDVADIERRAQELSARQTELAQQQIALKETLAAARARYTLLLERLAIPVPQGHASASDATLPFDILAQNPQYQMFLRQLQAIDQQMAAAYGQRNPATPLEVLQAQYDTTLHQLQQAAQATLGEPGPDVQNAQNVQTQLPAGTVQAPIQRELMAEAIATAQQIQVLESRTQSIQQIEAELNRHTHQLATLLRQQDRLQQELNTSTRILEDYRDRREALQAQVAQEYVTWQALTSPTLVTDAAGQPQAQVSPLLPGSLGIGAGIGILVGMVVSHRLDQQRATEQRLDLAHVPALP
ncbi:MAG: hypothetical protein VKK04_15900 [Synechococcales bacterium]|nr:hypothetical protein [Synechococcales bacterium]